MIYTVGSCHSIDSSLMTVSICDSFLYREMMSLHRDITAYTGMDRLNGSGGHRHYDIPQGASLLAGGWARRHRLRHHIAKAWWSNALSAWADMRRTSQGLRTQGQSEVASVGSSRMDRHLVFWRLKECCQKVLRLPSLHQFYVTRTMDTLTNGS